jgi:cyclopropane fatty-acyl-phospholipid synthase-like methyltransferase
MPTGFPDSLTPVARFIEWLQPGTVLDVGVGGGRMGFLAKEYGHVPWHPRGRGEQVTIHGIEGYEPYIGDLQRAIYDVLMVGEANQMLQKLASDERRYDLVIASDVLEHFTSRDAESFIDRCIAVGEVIVVVTPGQFFEQVSDENPLETHRSFWPESTLKQLGATLVLHRETSTVCLFGSQDIADAYRLAQRRGRRSVLSDWVLPPAWRRLIGRLRVQFGRGT